MSAGVQSFENVFIIGFGETAYHKKNQWDPLHYIINAARRTIISTDLSPRKINGLAVSSFRLPPGNVSTVAEHLGIEIAWTMHGAQGGASSVIQTLRAAESIELGSVDAILIVSGDAFTVDIHMDHMNIFNTSLRDYVAPYGFGGPNGLFAFIQRRHMHEYGTQARQLGEIAVAQRKNASLNKNALLREPMDIEDYLNARMIADPLRLYDCVLPCGGGGGILVTNGRIANQVSSPKVRILAGAESTNHMPNNPIPLESGCAAFSKELFLNAGINHSDIDLVQLYDDYPIMVAIQLEDYGFCKKGEAGNFIETKDLSVAGDLPLNTGGGQLSCGQAGAAGGIIGLVEGVRQLQHLAGDHQVKGATIGLVSGYGMVGYGHGLCSAALLLSTD